MPTEDTGRTAQEKAGRQLARFLKRFWCMWDGHRWYPPKPPLYIAVCARCGDWCWPDGRPR